MRPVSIRLRLTTWYAVVLLLGLSLFGTGMWFALQGRLIAGIDNRLTLRLQGVRSVGETGEPTDPAHMQRELEEFATENPDGTLIQLRNAHGTAITPFAAPSPFPEQPPGFRTVAHQGRLFRVLTTTVVLGGWTYQVTIASSLQEMSEVLRDFRNSLLFTIPAILSIACFGGYWLSVRALKPVDEITSVAKSVSVQNLSQRVTVPQTADELQRMAETWNGVLERLESSVERIRQFTADASHELRTPLALIHTTAELALRRRREPEEYRKALGDIQELVRQMTSLTEALLATARGDDSGLSLTMAPVDAGDLVTRTAAAHREIAEERQINLTACCDEAPLVASLDAAAISRLLQILLDNALKHTPARGTVTLSARGEAGRVVLSVSDTGEGITAEVLPHIFERFYRGDRARTGGSGFGLGLSIAQSIANAHGTKIDVESAPGRGSMFSVSFPAWRDVTPKIASAAVGRQHWRR